MPDFNPDPNAFPLKRFPFPWRAVHLPVVPAVFDNSLSLLEVCQKMLHWLNQTIEQMNALHADIVALKEYVDSQDAATLAAANAYAVALRDALKEYVDAQDAATLASARSYADTQDAAILALAKAYADGLYNALKQYIDTQDAATLASAKTYADGLDAALRIYIDTQDAANLASAKTYADGLVSTLRAYVNTQLAFKQDVLTFDTAPTNESSNPVTSNGVFGAIQNALGTAVNYTNAREQTIRDDMTAMYYTVELASSQVTTLPTGISYSAINNAATNGKLVRIHVVAENWWYYYTEPCRFFRADVDNAVISIIYIDTQGNVLFDDFG